MSLIDSVFGNLGYERKGVQVVDRLEGCSAAERDTYARVEDRTMVWPANVLQAVNAVRYVVKTAIPGAIVECGVWRGGVSMAMLHELRALGDTSRDAYLYDTFEGMSAPGPEDRAWDGTSAEPKYIATRTSEGSDWCRASLEDVQAGIASIGYPPARVHFVKGKVEDTLPKTLPERIALLRLDTDWYASTKAEMDYLFPRLSPGGVLIVDDYGQWQGSRKAVDEYFENHSIQMFLAFNGPVAYGVKR